MASGVHFVPGRVIWLTIARSRRRGCGAASRRDRRRVHGRSRGVVGRSRRRQNAGGRGGESDPSPQSLREGIEAGCGTGHHERVSFDSIPHAELVKSLSRRISDRHLLGLIKMWLVAPVEEIDERGRRRRTTRNKDERRGSPQGSPLSPLLANIYMRRFIVGWKVLGYEQRLDAHIVNYADDFVICCRGTANEAMTVMRGMMSKLRLTVNETKTRLCRVPEGTFDFLGYTIGQGWSPKTGKSYIGTKPSAKKIDRLKREISDQTSRKWFWTDVEDRVARLNRMLLGWSNYFCLGPVSASYRAIDRHARERLRHWLRRKHKLKSRGTTRFPDQYLHDVLDMVRLSDLPKTFPWAKA